MSCQRSTACHFFSEHRESTNPHLRMLTEKYCTGEHSAKCMRNLFISIYSTEPDIELLPNGFSQQTT